MLMLDWNGRAMLAFAASCINTSPLSSTAIGSVASIALSHLFTNAFPSAVAVRFSTVPVIRFQLMVIVCSTKSWAVKRWNAI